MEGKLNSATFDLYRSTIERECGTPMTFCYYQEIDDTTVYTGLSSLDGKMKVFTKLIDNEPVDLSVKDWKEQWSRFPEFIPKEKNISPVEQSTIDE